VGYKGAVYPGRHEAIVSHDAFDRVQDILNFRSDTGQRDRILTHYLKGVLFCQRCHEQGRTARLIYTEATGKNNKLRLLPVPRPPGRPLRSPAPPR
jgi:site-specific DNA recombinase